MNTTSFWGNSTLAIRLSTVLHAGSLLGALIWSELWFWFLTAIISNHLLIFIAVFFPRSQFLGRNIVQLPQSAKLRREIALTFDDGPDPEITPRVLDILAQYNAKASFFCIASRAQLYPELVQEIIRQGHSVENHSRYHSNRFALLGWRSCLQEVQAAQRILSDITGTQPQFFRAPMGFRGPYLDSVLRQAGLRYTSWTRRGFDATCLNPIRIQNRLLQNLNSGDILLLHDGIFWPRGRTPHITLQVLPLILAHLQKRQYNCVSLPTAFENPDAR